jgi:hypothetical protein
MPAVKHAPAYGALESPSYLDFVSQGGESWVLNLPPRLQAYQGELELLLGKVFSGCPKSPHNLELAQQMTLNWCLSKCKKIGINIDESFKP